MPIEKNFIRCYNKTINNMILKVLKCGIVAENFICKLNGAIFVSLMKG